MRASCASRARRPRSRPLPSLQPAVSQARRVLRANGKSCKSRGRRDKPPHRHSVAADKVKVGLAFQPARLSAPARATSSTTTTLRGTAPRPDDGLAPWLARRGGRGTPGPARHRARRAARAGWLVWQSGLLYHIRPPLLWPVSTVPRGRGYQGTRGLGWLGTRHPACLLLTFRRRGAATPRRRLDDAPATPRRLVPVAPR